ncbi:hypothetical protein ACFY4C_41975 [Actinomadura viridis]|uniref:hypothetical protein n=1 Tax=Actinomadura viridis TaxID=58110 RepID=UPI0036897A29
MGRSHRTGRYTTGRLLDYSAVDLTGQGVDESMRQRDEFNFSVGVEFGEPTTEVSATT